MPGYALCVLFQQSRRFDDYVLFQLDGEDRDGAEVPRSGAMVELSHSPIVLDSDRGPALIIDRVLPTRFEDPSVWIQLVTSDLIPGTRTEDVRREPKVAWNTSRSSDGQCENFHPQGDLDPYPVNDALRRLHPRS